MKCKQCGQEFTPGEVPSPFCSDRCRLLDLGAWASEKYRIAGKQNDESIQTNVESLEDDKYPPKKQLH